MWNLWKLTRCHFADEGDDTGGGVASESFMETGLSSKVPEPIGDSSEVVNEPTLESEEYTKDPQGTDPEQEETSKPETKEGLLQRLWDKVSGASKDGGEDAHSSELEEDISSDFTEAALAAGWTEDKIVKFAESYGNEQLDEMIPFLVQEEENDTSEQEDDTSSEPVSKDTTDKNKETKGAGSQEQIESVTERVARLEQERAEYLKREERRQRAEVQRTVDNFFDSAAKEFPVFGQTKNLPVFPDGTPQAGQFIPHGEAYHARTEVLHTAQAFSKMGMSNTEALEQAMTWYKGKYLEKDIHRKLVRDLKQQEKRVSPRRRERVTPKAQLTSREAIINDIALKAGIE